MNLALLWGLFLIPVSLAAFFGALRFAAVHPRMVDISGFFQLVAMTLGSCGLMLGAYGVTQSGKLHSRSVLGAIGLGLVLLALVLFFEANYLKLAMSVVAIVTVVAVAIGALMAGQRTVGVYLLAGVLLSVAAIGSASLLASRPDLVIDVYHYLMAASLLCFGLAAPRGPIL